MNLNGMKEEDLDVYSEPETDDRGVDRGVEIVDMDDIKSLDWMAPESLKKVKEEKVRVKKSTKDVKGKGKAKGTVFWLRVNLLELRAVRLETDAVNDVDAEEKDAAKALDLSESEEDEPLDDVLEEFLHFQDDDGVCTFPTAVLFATNASVTQTTIQDKLYFFQFPTPFPTFLPLPTSEIMDVEMEPPNPSSSTSGPRKSVSFANGSRPGVPDEPPAPDEKPKVAPPIDGVIGQLEMYKSGAVKMRLGNGIVMDVSWH
jgi:DNA-directed RNA polymerase III subunit RPC4